MTAPQLKRAERAACSVCGRGYLIDRKGRLTDHPEPADPRSSVRLAPFRCEGSGETPEVTR